MYLNLSINSAFCRCATEHSKNYITIETTFFKSQEFKDSSFLDRFKFPFKVQSKT